MIEVDSAAEYILERIMEGREIGIGYTLFEVIHEVVSCWRILPNNIINITDNDEKSTLLY
jgi:hypothetical protein